MDILLQTIISEFSRKALKDPKNPLRFFLISLYMTHPRGLLGSWRGGWRPPQLGPYKSGDAKGHWALHRSKKEGGHRPPEPSRYIQKSGLPLLLLPMGNTS